MSYCMKFSFFVWVQCLLLNHSFLKCLEATYSKKETKSKLLCLNTVGFYILLYTVPALLLSNSSEQLDTLTLLLKKLQICFYSQMMLTEAE